MEWVETTGRTLAEAIDAALDQLGVHEDEAEIEVISEGKAGILGRIGARDARVRARVKPISPRSAIARRCPRRGLPQGRVEVGSGGGRGEASKGADGRSRRGAPPGAGRRQAGYGDAGSAPPVARWIGTRSESQSRGGSPRGGPTRRARTDEERRWRWRCRSRSRPRRRRSSCAGSPGVRQAGRGRDLDLRRRGLDPVDGDDLGALVGPAARPCGPSRISPERSSSARRGVGARIRVDIGGYQAKRREALPSSPEARPARGRDRQGSGPGTHERPRPQGRARRRRRGGGCGDGVEGEDPRAG